ncbi:hypothetical protein LMG29542_08744 [Paraburkholderia humisilvae]|uniref:Uncharacterized protein n=1 Tax=Paraburkholderia humisilvae TaxID=627669 RepID=A0A6J5FCF3_9BURK|nr:hypothetical protein LMG29542_08744 [Paraburkholderia humisilvae]
MNMATIGLDLAKNVLQVHAVDLQGQVRCTQTALTLRYTSVFRHAAPVCNRHGGVRLLALLGPRTHKARTYGSTDRPRNSSALTSGATRPTRPTLKQSARQ